MADEGAEEEVEEEDAAAVATTGVVVVAVGMSMPAAVVGRTAVGLVTFELACELSTDDDTVV
jgi:hypothetical protein